MKGETMKIESQLGALEKSKIQQLAQEEAKATPKTGEADVGGAKDRVKADDFVRKAASSNLDASGAPKFRTGILGWVNEIKKRQLQKDDGLDKAGTDEKKGEFFKGPVYRERVRIGKHGGIIKEVGPCPHERLPNGDDRYYAKWEPEETCPFDGDERHTKGPHDHTVEPRCEHEKPKKRRVDPRIEWFRREHGHYHFQSPLRPFLKSIEEFFKKHKGMETKPPKELPKWLERFLEGMPTVPPKRIESKPVKIKLY